jgi:hypothetical protein
MYALIEDGQRALWLYTQCGLVEIAGTELQRWWAQPDITMQLKTFEAFDGVQPGRAPFAGAARSPDGRLWFANSVMQMIDPDHLSGNALPPPVHVEGVIAGRKNYSPRKDLRLPPLTRDLEIDYTALSFVAPQKMRFRYKLEGRDADWQEPGTRRQAFYSDLRPRRYRFGVIACNNDGVWNEAGATLDFSVAPAWYQTNWFRILCIVSGVLIIVWVLYQLRVRQIARSIGVRFDERLAERTRMARDVHDTFLQTLQGSKLVADDALEPSTDPIRMRRAMEQLSVWLGRATQEGRAALNSLRTATTQTNGLAEALRRVTEKRPHSKLHGGHIFKDKNVFSVQRPNIQSRRIAIRRVSTRGMRPVERSRMNSRVSEVFGNGSPADSRSPCNKEIAGQLDICETTVNFHIKNLVDKLQANNGTRGVTFDDSEKH